MVQYIPQENRVVIDNCQTITDEVEIFHRRDKNNRPRYIAYFKGRSSPPRRKASK